MTDPAQPAQPQHRPGDIVNGWLLTESGQWVPATPPPAHTGGAQPLHGSAVQPPAFGNVPAAPPVKRRRKWPWIVAAVVVGALIVGNVADQLISSAITTAREEASSDEGSASSGGTASSGEGTAESEQDESAVVEEEPAEFAIDLSDFSEIDAATWDAIAADGESHVGEYAIVYAEVTQFDSNTGDQAVRASVGSSQPGGEYELETNTIVNAEADLLDGVVVGDVLKVHAIVDGTLEYDSTFGGTNVVPSLTAVVIERVGYKDLSADVVLGAAVWSGYGGVDVPVTITNSSTAAMGYSVEIVAESPDGGVQYDSSYAYADHLQPGQASTNEASFYDIPGDAVFRVVEVTRNAE
ncbi:hypothetical protein GCM10023351_15860 [Microbacterium gilvum]|uniref:Uncharacterized protein n=1 Tax=Microbacterium gilvum TaxID=1336204 RepID=A0ABP9A487_9MICO